MFGRGREAHAPEFNAVEVLTGLAPSLVQDLAGLGGQTKDDLLVSFQIMPWGDRATLAAYGVIELDNSRGHRGRVAKVNNQAPEIVNAAAEVLADTSRPDFAGLTSAARFDHSMRASLLAAAALPLIDVVDDQHLSAALTVPGLVQRVDSEDGYLRVTVKVPLTRDDLTTDPAPSSVVEVASRGQLAVVSGARVRLFYASDDVPLDQPDAMAVEPA